MKNWEKKIKNQKNLLIKMANFSIKLFAITANNIFLKFSFYITKTLYSNIIIYSYSKFSHKITK